ncbi:transposase [Streptomyces sp. NBC_01264]|uniref:transposase n=1 Tax=Streptomyces sp. NBC_01264 TaxID=2903804 RepID=UPI00224FBA99|nr:transposase [Streptomyces sp. NBC_01264]MCX4784325.1 transposase [Streptomyces sp. NBC_01264]
MGAAGRHPGDQVERVARGPGEHSGVRGLPARIRTAAVRVAQERRGYIRKHFPLLLTMLHARLGEPVTLVWDNYSSHTSAEVREWAAGQERWPRIVQLPPYAPELNPVEHMWKIVKDLLANRAFRSIRELADAADAALSYGSCR